MYAPQDAPVFRSLAGEVDTLNFVGRMVALHAPFAVFVLHVARCIRASPACLVGWRTQLNLPWEGRPEDRRIGNDDVRCGVGRLRVVEMMAGIAIEFQIDAVGNERAPRQFLRGGEIIQESRRTEL